MKACKPKRIVCYFLKERCESIPVLFTKLPVRIHKQESNEKAPAVSCAVAQRKCGREDFNGCNPKEGPRKKISIGAGLMPE